MVAHIRHTADGREPLHLRVGYVWRFVFIQERCILLLFHLQTEGHLREWQKMKESTVHKFTEILESTVAICVIAYNISHAGGTCTDERL